MESMDTSSTCGVIIVFSFSLADVELDELEVVVLFFDSSFELFPSVESYFDHVTLQIPS